MSFWPRMRKRSRGRRRTTSSATKSNPYASVDDTSRYNVVHEELQAQRAQFASERGVSTEVVRFVSRSSRGWVCFSSETTTASTTPEQTILTPPDLPDEFALPPPALPLSTEEPGAVRGGRQDWRSGQQEAAEASAAGGNVVMGLDVRGDTRRVGRLVVTRKLKDEAWLQISKTAAVLLVKVLVFSRALGASTAFAFTVGVVVDIWNRGRGSCLCLFSALTTQLLTTLRPYLSLQQKKCSLSLVRAAPRPVLHRSPSDQQLSVSNAMKVSPITEDSDAQDFRSSSFAFPVLTKEYVPTSPRFTNQVEQADSPEIGSPAESVSPVGSPLVESNKLPSSKPCRKLRSKLFKARKGENSSPRAADVAQSNDGAGSSGSSSNGSPSRGKSCKTRASSISGKPIKVVEEEVERPSVSSLKPPKLITRSHELLFFRSPNLNRKKELAASKEVAGVSRSQEVKFSLRSFGKKKVSRSQEFVSSTSPPHPVQDLTLPKSTVEGLEALAFPFKMDEGVQQHERSSQPGSPRQSSPSKRKSNLSKTVAVEQSPEKNTSRASDVCSSPSKGSSMHGSVKGGKPTTSNSSCSTSVSSCKSAMLAAAELKPGLRRVRTALPAGSEHYASDGRRAKAPGSSRGTPLPTQAGELGRSQVLSREILGSILLLAVLGFLLLGRIHAIAGTSCLCLILSHVQRFFYYHLTPKDKELLKRSAGGGSRLHHASSSPVHWPSGNSSTHWSPVDEKSGLQSSEYRKRVVIEGLLDRGNRRGAS